jgi:hypothetical protein
LLAPVVLDQTGIARRKGGRVKGEQAFDESHERKQDASGDHSDQCSLKDRHEQEL